MQQHNGIGPMDLVAHGVDPNRLTSNGYGESQPVDLRHNEAAWRINRRVSFVLRKQTQR